MGGLDRKMDSCTRMLQAIYRLQQHQQQLLNRQQQQNLHSHQLHSDRLSSGSRAGTPEPLPSFAIGARNSIGGASSILPYSHSPSPVLFNNNSRSEQLSPPSPSITTTTQPRFLNNGGGECGPDWRLLPHSRHLNCQLEDDGSATSDRQPQLPPSSNRHYRVVRLNSTAYLLPTTRRFLSPDDLSYSSTGSSCSTYSLGGPVYRRWYFA